MRQQIPVVVAVIIIAVAVILSAFLIWRFAGQKTVGTFEEFRQKQGQMMGSPTGGMMPAPRPPQQRGQPSEEQETEPPQGK